MSFKTNDFKKTTRTTDGERVLYPYQIKDDRFTASIGYAIAYYERMVGRRRGEFEAETLLEFFGDPRLARGLVACLARTYAWREQTFAEALGEQPARLLWRAGLASPAALRAKLYGLANGRYRGVILPHEREEALEFLCSRITEGADGNEAVEMLKPINAAPVSSAHSAHSAVLTPAQFERALALDSEDQHVLIKVGPTPEPHEIIALYNYHSLETALCHAEVLRLQLHGPVWNIIRSTHNLARRYRLHYEISGAPRTLFDERLELALHGGRDTKSAGHYAPTRTGRRVVRALLRLLAAHPDSLDGGEALVQLKGKKLTLKLDRRALQMLGVAAKQSAVSADAAISDAWDEDIAATFQKAWGRAFVRGRTAGWRLRRDPEPLIGESAIVVPDFALVRGRERLVLCLTTGIATTTALARDLSRLGGRVQALAIVPAHAAEGLRACPVPLATYGEQPAEAITALVATLERRHPRRASEQVQTPWQQLEQLVADEGFVEEQAVARLMTCSPEEAARVVQRWGGPTLHVLPGLGVCAPESLDEIRQLIEEGEIRQRAA
jgi:predicted nuclease of restriction endonuclease-like RecB superfamily